MTTVLGDEEVRAVHGFTGYFASRTGVIWRVREGKPPRRLKQHLCNGYPHVSARHDGGGKRPSQGVHRLVLLAFVGPCPPGQETRHLDGCRSNNCLDNLAWGTPVENAADRVRHYAAAGIPLGFAAMSAEQRAAAASRGGKTAHARGTANKFTPETACVAGRIPHVDGTAHKWTSETARAAGRVGGRARPPAPESVRLARVLGALTNIGTLDSLDVIAAAVVRAREDMLATSKVA